MIETGSSLATDAVGATLDLGSDVQAAGPSVHIEADAALSAADLGRLQVELPFTAEAALASRFLVVVYAILAADGSTQLGLIPAGGNKGYEIKAESLRFALRGYGNYQAVYLAVDVGQEITKPAPAISTQSQAQVDALPPIEVLSVRPLVARTGETLSLAGVNFREDLTLSFAGKTLGEVKLVNTQLAKVKMPQLAMRGGGELAVYQRGVETKVQLFYAGDAGDYPIVTKDPSEICTGERFYNAQGELKEGTRACSLPEVPCTGGGQVNCMTTATYPSLDKSAASALTDLSASNFPMAARSGTPYEFWDSTGQRHQVAGDSDLMASNIISGVEVLGVIGTAAMETHTNCASDGAAGCVVLGPSFAAALTTGLGSKVLTGQMVAGVAGIAVAETHSSCSSANQSGCVATTNYKTMDASAASAMSDLNSGNFMSLVKSNTAFEYWDSDGQRHQNSGDANLQASKLIIGTTVFGVSGTAQVESHSDCASDGSSSCVVDGNTYAAAALGGLAAKILSGNSVAGIPGTAIVETHSPCSAANQIGCVATSTYRTMDLNGSAGVSSLTNTNFTAALASASTFQFWDAQGTRYQRTGDTDLIPANISSGIDVFGVAGTALSETHSACGSDGATGCVVVGPSYAATVTAGLAPKVLTGQTVAGVSGTAVAETHSNCTSANQAGCVATATYSTMDLSAASAMNDLTTSNLETVLGTAANFEFWDSTGMRHQGSGTSQLTPGNIKLGVTLFGVGGAYPSPSYPLPSASATADLDDATFNAKIKSSTSFEYWKSDGTYQTGAGDPDIDSANIKGGVTVFGTTGGLTDEWTTCPYTTQASCEANAACMWSAGACHVDPWNIRIGTTVAGVSGSLKTNCRNRANSTLFNADAIPPGDVGTTVGVTIDWWDTIDDSNSGGVFPSSVVAAWSSNTDCDKAVWRDLTADGSCDSAADDCLMQDRISGLTWSESSPVSGAAAGASGTGWSLSVQKCDALVYGGSSDWRLPTQKELQAAYQHGIRNLAYKGSGTVRATGSLDNNSAFIANVNGYFWTATTVSNVTNYAWDIYLGTGATFSNGKPDAYLSLCVRP